MALYVDVYVLKPVQGSFPPTPNPCVLKLNTMVGIRFRNLSGKEVRLNLTSVKGFEHVPDLRLAVDGAAIAETNSRNAAPGIYGYTITNADRVPGAPTQASPRVILDV